jgi:hypothetical protein
LEAALSPIKIATQEIYKQADEDSRKPKDDFATAEGHKAPRA